MIIKPLSITLIIFILVSNLGDLNAQFEHNNLITNESLFKTDKQNQISIPKLNPKKENNNPNRNLRLLILFKSKIFVNISRRNVDILHQYRYIPMILVKGSIIELVSFVEDYKEDIQAVYEDKSFNIGDEIQTTRIPNDIGTSSPALITGATRLWDMGYKGQGVKIGIIDTGISETHLDIAGKVVAKKSFVSTIYGYSENITDTDDAHGHGTSMAGIAAGAGIAENSGITWPGFAPEAELINAKIFHPNSAWEETTSAIIAAVEFCADNGADVINMSFGQYHNLPNEPRQAIINELSKNGKGIVFSISAGNQGYSGIDGGSLDNPGTALQGICVANADNNGNIVSSSSSGPKIDYSMKPDIAAPGTGVMSPARGTTTSFTSVSGTSPAAACISGAAALLVSYLKANGIPYTTGTIKGTLLKGAIDHETAPDWREGAGFLNISQSLDILISAPRLASYPVILYPHPQNLPFYPTTLLFQGQWLDFNLTLVASPNLNLSTLCSPTLEPYLQVPQVIEAGNSTLCQIRINIPEDAVIGFVRGNITFSTALIDCKIPVEFQIEQPAAKILFDEVHTMITRRSIGGLNYGDQNFFYGIFRDYIHMLMDNHILVQPFVRSELTEALLSAYDALVLPDPATYVYDPYTDWIEPTELTSPYCDFSEVEEAAIKHYISNGGGLLVFSLGNIRETTYLPELNQLLSDEWGIEFKTDTIGLTSIEIKYPSWNIWGNLSYEGTELSVSSDTATVIADHDGKACIAAHVTDGGGRVLVIGSDLMFDNQRQPMYYNRNGSLVFTQWICKIIPSNVFVPNATNTTNTTNNEFSINIFIIFFITIIGACYLARKRRYKD